MKRTLYLIFCLPLFLVGCANQEQTTETPEADLVLGKLEHGFTLNPATQEKFDEGLLLLHNFEYDDALTAFEEATASDSTEVLTHWGEAMCHYKALWRLQNTENGKAILERFGKTKEERLASIEEPLEKDLWEVVEIMYGEGDFDERNQQIKEHLAAMHKAYPTNQEVASFYVLSLIWATEEYGNGSEDLRLAASIADSIIQVNPLHPGALHYKIHALDGPTSANDALDAADAYAGVATDASHALHMPSHIYLAIGEWEGVINSNRRSYDASVVRMEELELEDGARGYHAFAWLHYGLLQKGQYEKAEGILNEMLSLVPKDPTKGARGYLLGMQSRQLAESGMVNSETDLDLEVKADDIGIVAKSVRSFLRAQVAFENGDASSIQEEMNWLAGQIQVDSIGMEDAGIAMCAAGTSRYAATENGIKMAKVMQAQMGAMQAQLGGEETLFETQMLAATELESQTDFPTGPPRITNPSFEQYGEWLLANDRYEEAQVQFESALARMPNRARSLKGKFLAHKGLNQMEEAAKVQEQLESLFAKADAEVKSFLDDERLSAL